MIDITGIIVCIITLLFACFSTLLLPYLKLILDDKKLEQLFYIAKVAVDAAEQLGVSKQIEDKFEYAKTQIVALLKEKGLKFDEFAIRLAIESAVKNLNKK